MRLWTDDYYVIGGQHALEGKPCQDHTLSGLLPEAAYAILSDGCSSGGLTDIGARIATTSVRTAIRNHAALSQRALDAWAAQDIDLQQQVMLSGVRSTLGLSQNDMLATSAYAYLTPKGGLVHMRGDGVIAFAYHGGAYRLHRFEWAGNAPLYPIYAEDNFDTFRAFHKDDAQKAVVETVAHAAEGDPPSVINEIVHTLEDGIRGITIPVTAEDMRSLSYVALMSDGVTQVNNVEWMNAALRLVSFKNAEGSFAKRRLIRFLKEAHKEGDGPVDDISLSVIRIDQNDEENTHA